MIVDLVLGLPAGLVAGALFFGGLRWTILGLTRARHPTLLAVASFVLRTTLVVAILVVTVDGRPIRALAILAGFVITRTALVARERRLLEAEGTSWT